MIPGWLDSQRRAAARWGRRAWRVGIFLVLLAAAGLAAAAEPAPPPWHISADRLEHDHLADRYLAVGSVTITREGIQLSADRVLLDRRTMRAEAEGHVMVTFQNDVVTGQRLTLDLAAETGTIYQGTIFLSENHFYIRSDRIEKVGPSTYRADPVQVTTCDGPDPAWRISGRRLDVTVEGYGKLDHATFWARQMPLLYSPRLIFPAKRERQSGLLPPQIALSDRLGADLTQPFFWAIDDHQDATVYLRHLGRRGQMIGTEYRYVLGPGSRGTLMADLLEDRRIDDGTPASEDWAYSETPARGNRDRYWFRARVDQDLPAGFTAKLDLDLVSDADYLREFRAGPSGFTASDRVFADTFGRELDAFEDPVRTNRLNLSRIWPDYSLNLDTRWLDDLIGRRQDGVNRVLQQLHSITLDGVRQPVARTPLHFDLASQYRYFYLENRRRGQRLDLYPRVYWPLRAGRFMGLEPSLGLRETVWHVASDDRAETPLNEVLDRQVLDFSLDASSQLSRVYRPGRWGLEALKHSVRPQLIYDYVPRVGQDRYPRFDGLDRIEEVNQITGVLTQTVTSRTRPPDPPPASAQAPDPARLSPVYREIAYLEISGGYDILEARRGNPVLGTDPDRRQPFTPIRLEAEFSPCAHLRLSADASRSPYSDHYAAHHVGAQINDWRGDELFVEHRYTYRTNESIFTQLLVPLTENLTTYAEWERNLQEDHHLEVGAGLLYTAQCWALDLGYAKEHGSGKRLAFMVHLYGLGGLGQSSVIQRRIDDPFDWRDRRRP